MKRIISSVICLSMFVAVFVFSAPKASADLSWTCTQYRAYSMYENWDPVNGEYIEGIDSRTIDADTPWSDTFDDNRNASDITAPTFCYTANISGSVSAAITEAEKQDIANRIINSTRLQNIETYSKGAKEILDGTANGGKSLSATYDRANTAAANAVEAKEAAERPNVFRVVKGQAFTEIMYGEINGSSGGVTATSAAGSGYTTITGTINTAGVKTITIGGKTLLFKVVEAPTTSYKAAVSFSE